jgi:hypothetical protein
MLVAVLRLVEECLLYARRGHARSVEVVSFMLVSAARVAVVEC